MISEVISIVVPLALASAKLLKGEDCGAHSRCKERIILLHIHDMEAKLTRFFRGKTEIEPVCETASVYIVL
jgi:hypothetical protein